MQKRDKSGSILIWSLFFSTFIAFMFISISTSINKNIKDSATLSDYIDDYLLNESIEKAPMNFSSELGENETVEKKESTYSFYKNDIKEFRFNESSNININIEIKKWGPIHYIFLASSGSLNPWVTSTWVVSTSKSFFSWLWTKKDGILYIKNLAWYTEISLTASWTIIPEKEIYSRIKNYWWYELEKGSYEVINFVQWSFPWINFNSFWMEFN